MGDNNELDDVDMEEVKRYVKEYDFPVHMACRERVETKIIAYLIENIEIGKLTVNKMDSFSRFPLHYACRYAPASLATIKYLVENVPQGEKVLKKGDRHGNTPLHLACDYGSSVDVIEYLVKKGIAAVNKTNQLLQYPLHIACKGFLLGGFLRFGVIKCLVENGNKESILSKQKNGCTPKYLAGDGGGYMSKCVVQYLENATDILDLEERVLAEGVLAEQESSKKQLQEEIAQLQYEAKGNHIAGKGPEEFATREQEKKRKRILTAASLFDRSPEPPPKRKCETKKEYLSDILFDLWNDGLMAGKTRLAEIAFPERFKNKNKKKAYFTALMELCDLVLLENDTSILFKRDGSFDHSMTREKTDKIQNRAFKKMQQLDNQTAEQLQPTYALGKRYYDWSKKSSNPISIDALDVAAGRAPSNGDHGRSASKSEALSKSIVKDLTNPPNSNASGTDPLKKLLEEANHFKQTAGLTSFGSSLSLRDSISSLASFNRSSGGVLSPLGMYNNGGTDVKPYPELIQPNLNTFETDLLRLLSDIKNK